MIKIRLKYLSEDVDRHGNVRLYVRIPGRPKIRLKATPGTAEFLRAYEQALGDRPAVEKSVRNGPAKGSFGYVCLRYFQSPAFKALDISTRTWRRRALEAMCKRHGIKPVGMMQARHVRALRDERADKPGAANMRLKALRALFRWAVEADEAPHDPAREVQLIRYVQHGHHSWTLEEVRTFEEVFEIGTKARLALSLLLYTACRREDVVRFGPQHVSGGRLKYTQAKNEHRNPSVLDIPVHPDLQIAIEHTSSGHLTFLVSEQGRPFTPAGFGNKFRDWCNEAGLPHCTAHGLRKAAAARLAERGATAHEIMAVTGHKTLAEVERYTRDANKAKLADAAMAKLRRDK